MCHYNRLFHDALSRGSIKCLYVTKQLQDHILGASIIEASDVFSQRWRHRGMDFPIMRFPFCRAKSWGHMPKIVF